MYYTIGYLNDTFKGDYMKKILLAIIAVLMLSMPVQAKPLNLNQILEATCRIGVEDAYGTGTTIAHQRGFYYILTNAHVVGKFSDAEVEFFTGGAKTLPLQAKVIWRAFREGTDVDFALLTLPDTAIKGWSPRVIPLAPRAFEILRGVTLSSAGCPEARWPMAWEGAVLQDAGSRIIFTPPPTGGQSGSGVFLNVPDARGEYHTRLGAIITWRIGASDRRNSNGYDVAAGGAIPVSTIYNAFEGRVSTPRNTPDNYTPIQTNVKKEINYREYALGSNGKYYRVSVNDKGEKVAIGLPDNVVVLRWPEDIQVRFPSNPLFSPAQGFSGRYNNRRGNNDNNNNPYNFNGGRRRATPDNEYDLPDIGGIIGGGGETPKLPDVDVTPRTNNGDRQLISRINQLERDKANLLALLKKQDGIIANLNVKLSELLENEEYQAGQISELSIVIAAREEELAGLTETLGSTTISLNETKIELESTENVALQRNVLGAFSGVGVLSVVGWFLWTMGFGQKISDKVDLVEDIIQDKIEPIIGVDNAQAARDIVERLETWLEDFISSHTSGPQEPTETTVNTKHDVDIETKLKVIIEGLTNGVIEEKHPFDHDNFTPPPSKPVYQEPGQQVVSITKQPSSPPPRVEGLNPCPPEYPAHMYSSHEILDAVDYIERRYSDDPLLSKLNSLVRGALKAPRRPKTF